MDAIEGSWRPALHPGVAWVLVNDEIVAIDSADQVHLVPSTGALLWQLLDGSASIDDLAADVADVFGIELDVARRDVAHFATDMVSRGLVPKPDAAANGASS